MNLVEVSQGKAIPAPSIALMTVAALLEVIRLNHLSF